MINQADFLMLPCFKKFFCLQGALVLAFFFVIASFAQASDSHHTHHKVKVISPFDKVSTEKPLHCLLNAHLQHAKIDCPHKNNHTKSAEFRADCGSHPGSSHQKVSSFGSDLSQLTQDDFTYHLASRSFHLIIDSEVRFTPLTIEHPPQLS